MDDLIKVCKKHGEGRFFLRKDTGTYRCRQCNSDAVAKRRRKLKQILVQEAGGACQICGYDRYIGALDFHHKDPSEKLYGFGCGGLTRSIARLRVEAAKCALLCANCHREVEAGVIDSP